MAKCPAAKKSAIRKYNLGKHSKEVLWGCILSVDGLFCFTAEPEHPFRHRDGETGPLPFDPGLSDGHSRDGEDLLDREEGKAVTVPAFERSSPSRCSFVLFTRWR